MVFRYPGLHIGYGLTGAVSSQHFSRFAGLQIISALGALESLENVEWLSHPLALLATARAEFSAGLAILSLPYFSGPVNFILHGLPVEGAIFQHDLQRNGVRVAYPIAALLGWCRVAIGGHDEVSYYLSLLRVLCACR